MRKLKLQLQLTADGFMAGPKGEMDWMTPDWTEDINEYVTGITAPVDTIVLGRKLAAGFIPHWAAVAAAADHPEYLAGRKFTDTLKVVFSQSLDRPEGGNTVLAAGGLTTEISRLKNQPGQDIIAYGGATFAASLVRHDLVDEYHFFINPIAIGAGLPVFDGPDARRRLTLKTSRAFRCGIVLLCYAPARA